MKAEWTNKDVLTQSDTTGKSKAILILDVPEKLVGKIGNKLRIVGEEYDVDWKLRPLPEKKVGDDLYERYGSWTLGDEKEVSYRVGFNDCLDEILGEQNEQDE